MIKSVQIPEIACINNRLDCGVMSDKNNCDEINRNRGKIAGGVT